MHIYKTTVRKPHKTVST